MRLAVRYPIHWGRRGEDGPILAHGFVLSEGKTPNHLTISTRPENARIFASREEALALLAAHPLRGGEVVDLDGPTGP
jgi:hypothetical protein